MNTAILIQARLGSKRLPRKMMELIAGVPVVCHVLRRAEIVGCPVKVLCPKDDENTFRMAVGGTNVFGWDGPVDDVLSRFASYVKTRPEIDGIIRLTGDCPFVDVETIRAVVRMLEAGADFVSTNPAFGEPWIDGYDVEAFTRDLLERADAEATTLGDREHVTPWMRRNATNCWTVHRQPDGTRHRWTLDTAEDLEWFRRTAEHIDCTPPNHPTHAEMMALLKQRPELRRTNP